MAPGAPEQQYTLEDLGRQWDFVRVNAGLTALKGLGVASANKSWTSRLESADSHYFEASPWEKINKTQPYCTFGVEFGKGNEPTEVSIYRTYADGSKIDVSTAEKDIKRWGAMCVRKIGQIDKLILFYDPQGRIENIDFLDNTRGRITMSKSEIGFEEFLKRCSQLLDSSARTDLGRIDPALLVNACMDKSLESLAALQKSMVEAQRK